MEASSSITESLWDYLEIIFRLIAEKKVARVKDIAKEKGVSMASVNGAMKRLAEEGLINYKAREYIEFTAEGEQQARRMVLRHEFLTRFLTDILLVPGEIAEEDACAIEHHLSLETLDRMVSFTEFIRSCPRGELTLLNRFTKWFQAAHSHEDVSFNHVCIEEDPCTLRDGRHRWRRKLGRQYKRTLLDLKPGEEGRVFAIHAKGSIRQRLIDMGILPDVIIKMDQTAPFGDPIKVKVKGYYLTLRKEEAEAIGIK